jgi:hypothetical protein
MIPSSTFVFLGVFRASDIFLPHPSSPNSFCLGPRSYEKPIDLISSEANRIPFVSQDIDLESWSDSLRTWPNPPEGWIIWYNRMADAYQPMGIHRNSRCSVFIPFSSWKGWKPSENHWLLLVRCLELFPFWAWSDDPNSHRCYDDHWLRYLIDLSFCL